MKLRSYRLGNVGSVHNFKIGVMDGIVEEFVGSCEHGVSCFGELLLRKMRVENPDENLKVPPSLDFDSCVHGS